MAPVLASLTAEKAHQILLASALLALIVIICGVGLWLYRRRWLGDNRAEPGAGWTLEDLRKLRKEGNLTEEEYQALRSALIGAVRGGTSSSEPPANRPVAKSSDDMGPILM